MTNTELESPKSEADNEQIIVNKHNTRSSVFLWCAVGVMFIFVCVGGGAAFWFFQQHYQPLLETVEDQQAVKSNLSLIANTQKKLQDSLSQQQQSQRQIFSTVQQLQNELSVQESQLSSLNTDLANMNGARASDWLIAEADYLARMAGRKLWLEDDTQTAILLLREADLRLEEVGDPALISARKAIAADMQALSQLDHTSSTDLAIELSGLISVVDTLPINTILLPDVEGIESAELSEDVSDWKANLSKVWRSLVDDFISIEKRSAPVEPMINEAQRFLVKEQLKLTLQQAQYAAIQNNAPLFKNSLKQAQVNIQANFDADSAHVSHFKSTLDKLSKAEIEPSLPHNLSSFNMIKQALDTRLNAQPSEQE